jgi:hypothetical protein
MMRIRIRRTISEIIELMGSEHSTGMSINHIRKAGQNPFPPFALISERGEVVGGGGGAALRANTPEPTTRGKLAPKPGHTRPMQKRYSVKNHLLSLRIQGCFSWLGTQRDFIGSRKSGNIMKERLDSAYKITLL